MLQNKIMLTFSLLVVCFFAFALSTGDEMRKFSVTVRIVTAIFALGFSAVLFLMMMLVLNWIFVYASKLTGVIGAHKMEIKEDGLEESTDVNKGLHRWNPSFRIKETGSYVFIYPTEGHLFQIPKRAGQFEGDLNAFLDQLRTKVKSHAAAP